MHGRTSMLGLMAVSCCTAGMPWASAGTPVPPTKVVVGGAVTAPLHLDGAALGTLPRRSFEHHGRRSAREGVALADVLREVGAPLGDALRARNYRCACA
jgi:hypothetical protein